MPDLKTKWPWPTNVGLVGTHPEEVKALRGRIEKNPQASPMPELAPTNLLTPNRSSESLRMGGPPLENDPSRNAPSFKLTHVVFRKVLSRARRQSAVLFDDAVDAAALTNQPSGRREQMRRMLSREQRMLEILDRYNGLAEDVYMRLLASSKG